MFGKLPLVARLLLVIGLVTIAGLGAGVVAISSMSGAQTDALSYREGTQLGYRYAEMVQRQLNDAMNVSRFIATSVISFKKGGGLDRAQLNTWLKDIAGANPSVLGVWVGMEPNALDGKDAEFVGMPGSDASGRFLPYWNRASGEVALETLTGYDDTGTDGAYYQTPKRLRKEAIVEPYTYTVAGRQVLMTSLAVPIIEDGRFIGVAGVDISTDGIWNLLKTAKPFETGAVFLVSNEGAWAAYSNASHLGQPIVKTNERLKPAIPFIRDGKSFEHFSFSASLQKEIKQLILPVSTIPSFFL